jgi:hypothetical protein
LKVAERISVQITVDLFNVFANSWTKTQRKLYSKIFSGQTNHIGGKFYELDSTWLRVGLYFDKRQNHREKKTITRGSGGIIWYHVRSLPLVFAFY